MSTVFELKKIPLSLKKLMMLLEKLNDAQKKTLIKQFEQNKKDSKYVKFLNIIYDLFNADTSKIEKNTEEDFYLLLLRKGIILHKDSQKRSMELSQLCASISERTFELLRQYQEKENNQKTKLLQILQDINILYNLKLYDHCLSKIEEAEILAKNLESFHLLFEINFFKKKIILNAREKIVEFSTQTDAIFANDNSNLHLLSLLHTLFQGFVELLTFQNLRNLDHPKIAQIEASLLDLHRLNSKQISNNFELSYYYYQSKILILQLQKTISPEEKDEIIQYFQLLLAIINSPEHKAIFENDPNRYLQLLHNFVITAARIGRFEAIPDIDFKALFGNKIHDIDSILFINNILIVRDIFQQQWHKAKVRIEENNFGRLEDFFETHKEKILTHHKIAYMYNILLVQFVCADYEKSSFWANQILQESHKNVNIDHIILVKYIHLILLHLSDHPNIDMTLRNTYEYIKRYEKMTPINRQIYDFFSRFIETRHDKKLKAQTIVEHKAICVLTIAESHTLKPYNIFLAWMDSESTKQPIIETIGNYL